MGINDQQEERGRGYTSQALPFYCNPDGTIKIALLAGVLFGLKFLFLFYNWGLALVENPLVFILYVLLQEWFPYAAFLFLVWQFGIQDKTQNPLSKYGVLFAAALAFQIAYDVLWHGMPMPVIFNPSWIFYAIFVEAVVFGVAAFMEKQTIGRTEQQDSKILDDWFKRK